VLHFVKSVQFHFRLLTPSFLRTKNCFWDAGLNQNELPGALLPLAVDVLEGQDLKPGLENQILKTRIAEIPRSWPGWRRACLSLRRIRVKAHGIQLGSLRFWER
jgi:hypothetical protein